MATVRNAHIQKLVGKERLQSLQTRSNSIGLSFFFGHLLLTGLTGTVLWLALASWWVIPAMVLHGIVVVHWFAPCHECVHGTAFRSPWLNTWVGFFSGAIILINAAYFKYEHVAHHAYTADVEKDPERIPVGETFWGYLYYATGIPYFKGIVDVLWRIPLGKLSVEEQRFIPLRRRKEVQYNGYLLGLIYMLIVVVSILLQSWAAVIFWLLPRLIGEPFMRLIRMTEHVGCEQVTDMLRNTRTVITSLPLRLLAWNMCYHTEHHAFPQLPFYSLPATHRVLRKHLKFLCYGYPQAQKELIRNGLRNSGYVS